MTFNFCGRAKDRQKLLTAKTKIDYNIIDSNVNLLFNKTENPIKMIERKLKENPIKESN